MITGVIGGNIIQPEDLQPGGLVAVRRFWLYGRAGVVICLKRGQDGNFQRLSYKQYNAIAVDYR